MAHILCERKSHDTLFIFIFTKNGTLPLLSALHLAFNHVKIFVDVYHDPNRVL